MLICRLFYSVAITAVSTLFGFSVGAQLQARK